MKSHHVKSESLFLDGIEFRRYPDSKNWSDRVYFKPNGTNAARGIRAYHHELWKSLHGDIPPGFHVHHRDNDPLNNDPANLELVENHAHQEKHGDKTKSAEYKIARRNTLERIRPLAAEWHRSTEGREWHRQHGQETWQGRVPVSRICEQCGNEFLSLNLTRTVRFCSNKCKSANRRKSGKDSVERTCAYCRKSFHCNKYEPTRCCSESCAKQLRDAHRMLGIVA